MAHTYLPGPKGPGLPYRANLSSQRQAEHAEGSGRLDVHAPLFAAFLDDVPRAVVGLEPQFADFGDFREELRAHLVYDLLDARRFERLEHVHDDSADAGGD